MTQPAVPADANPESHDFLAPAQGPDELGRLGTYRVLKVLGSGGMGVVFLAEDLQLKRKIALKVLKPAVAARGTSKQRFLREAQSTAALRHDNVITIYQVGEDRGVPFLAMEFLEGMALDEYLKKGRKPNLAQLLRMGREIARGLQAAHERGMIHRDIKPANIWLEAQQGRVKILDFGLARATDDDTHLTQDGAILGTPSYMSPEQARGKKVDHRSDLFGLGCVLYRLCAGQAPFKGESPMATLVAVARETPPSIHEIDPSIPKALIDLIDRLMAKNPEDRPASAKEVIAAIQVIERAPAGAPIPAPVAVATRVPDSIATEGMELPEKLPRKSRRLPLIAGGVLALMVVGLMVLAIKNNGKSREGASTSEPPGANTTVPPGANTTVPPGANTTVAAKSQPVTKGPDKPVEAAPVKEPDDEPPKGFTDHRANAKRGKTESVGIDSKILGDKISLTIYTPPGYTKDIDYPVLYLIPHQGGDESLWINNQAITIFDNLVNDKKMIPMIVVMPRVGIDGGIDQYLLQDIIPYVDGKYQTLKEGEHRALAGFGLGGVQSLGTGFRNPKTFAWIGAFNPAMATTGARSPTGLLGNSVDLGKQLRLIWIACSQDNPAFKASEKLHDYLDGNKVPHNWNVFPQWGALPLKTSLYQLARKLFQPEKKAP